MSGEARPSAPPPGLCASCIYAQTIASSRGATFLRCNLSFSDPRFARYPTLPVVRCEGHQPRTPKP